MGAMNWGYPAIMLLALFAGGCLLQRTQRALPLTPREKLGVGLGAFIGAMLGAKLPFALSDWEGLWSGAVWFANGKTILFGIVGGYLGVELAKWILEVRVKTGDTYALPVAVAVAIGRCACFQAGCCFGRETAMPWGVGFATAPGGTAILRHPAQLYESLFHFLAALGIWWASRHDWCRGQRLKAYLMAYLGFRFVSEWWRPEPLLGAGLTVYQWTCLGLLPVLVALWVYDRPREKQLAC